MKVMHVINSLAIGGAEKLIIDSLPIYKRLGIEVSVLSLVHNDSFLVKKLEAEDIKYNSLYFKNVYNPLIIFKLFTILRRVDLVHVHLFPAQYWVAFAKRLFNLKTILIFTEHNTNNRRWGKFYFKPFDIITYKSFQQICCISNSVAKAFSSTFPQLENKLIVIENGINLKPYDAELPQPMALPQGIMDGDLIIIKVAGFRPEKDHETVIKSLLHLPQNIKLFLVGEGQLLDACKLLVSRLQLTSRVFFLGIRSDVPELFKYSHLAIQSSHWEGFGLVAIEAMASGTPIIGSNVPGLADVIRHDKLLFEKGNPINLANKIMHLLEDRIAYNQMVDYCTCRAKSYDINLMVEGYVNVYRSLMNKSRSIINKYRTFNKPKLIRLATVSMSLDLLLKGQLRNLNQNFDVVAVSGMDAHLSTVRDREGVRVESVSMQRQISPIKDLISLINLYFLFRREQPLIIHSLTPKAGLLSMVAGKLAGVPVRMHTFTGLIFPYKTGILKKILIGMDKVLCWASTNVYPEGQGVMNDLIKYKITSKSLKIIANGNINGVDVDYFNPTSISEHDRLHYRRELSIEENDKVLLYVGRLVGDKGINELVEAYSNILGEKIKLLLVGPQEIEGDALSDKTIKIIKERSDILSVGFQSDVRRFFAIADIFVFPSYREGFPNVLLQALFMGLPCIVTDISGSNEIVSHGYNGIIIPSKNANLLKLALEELLSDNQLYLKLKNNSRISVAEKFEQTTVWKCLNNEYNKLIHDI